MRRRLLGLLTLILALTSCVSDRKLISQGEATRAYYSQSYKAACVDVKGPPLCADCYDLGQALKRAIQSANEAEKLGKLPDKARENLKRLVREMEKKCPG